MGRETERRTYPNLRVFFEENPDVIAAKLADEFGISPPYMSAIKWGERQPPLHLALRISRRCAVPLESLIRKPGTFKKAS